MDTVLYQNGDVKLAETDAGLCFVVGEDRYGLSSHPYEPYLSLEKADGHTIFIHNSFTVDELRHAAQTGEPIRMITGNEYDIGGICMLLRKAVELGRKSLYIHYVEGCCFMDYMKEQGAVSPETAIDLTAAGLKNPRMMNTFIHSKHVGINDDGSFWVIKDIPVIPMITYEIDGGTAADETPDNDMEYNDIFSRVISNQVRFGYGYRTSLGKKQYYAWHGYPNRNDDYITIAEISREEFFQIEKEYPRDIIADRDTAERFRDKYVNGHKILKEGWNISL